MNINTTPGHPPAVIAKPRPRRKKSTVTPPIPPKTEAEIAFDKRIVPALQDLTRRLHQRNLDVAVRLAQQAARGRGPLVAHFAELGRRFPEALDETPSKPTLRVVKGGAA